MFELKGKVALLTGATAWLGRDMAEVFAEHGCDIIITSRTKSKADQAAEEIAQKYGVRAIGLPLDVNCVESVEALAKSAYEWQGHIDILVNNSGGGSGASEGHIFDRSYEAIENMIRTNLIGTIFVCKAVGAYMKAQKSGKIINIGSIAGMVGRDRRMYYNANKMEQPVDYAAAKGGVIALTSTASPPVDLTREISPQNSSVFTATAPRWDVWVVWALTSRARHSSSPPMHPLT